jgi:translation initiation factor IF-1
MEIEAQVIESLPNARYKVEHEGKEYVCYVAGKMRMNKIAVLVGDWVRVILDPYGGKETNRIIRRL